MIKVRTVKKVFNTIFAKHSTCKYVSWELRWLRDVRLFVRKVWIPRVDSQILCIKWISSNDSSAIYMAPLATTSKTEMWPFSSFCEITRKQKNQRVTLTESKSHGMQVAGWVIARCTGHRKEIFFSNSQGGVSAKTASWIFRRGFMIATVNQKRKTSGGKLPTKEYIYINKNCDLYWVSSFFSFLFFFLKKKIIGICKKY